VFFFKDPFGRVDGHKNTQIFTSRKPARLPENQRPPIRARKRHLRRGHPWTMRFGTITSAQRGDKYKNRQPRKGGRTLWEAETSNIQSRQSRETSNSQMPETRNIRCS